MAWTGGVTLATGDLVTEAMWNNYLGAAGSLEYLKTEIDRLTNRIQRDGGTVAYANPAGARAEDVVYRNTSGYDRIVAISCDIDDDDDYEIYCATATPPTLQIGHLYQNTATTNLFCAFTFVVPDDYYYKVNTAGGTPTIMDWTEWDRV